MKHYSLLTTHYSLANFIFFIIDSIIDSFASSLSGIKIIKKVTKYSHYRHYLAILMRNARGFMPEDDGLDEHN